MKAKLEYESHQVGLPIEKGLNSYSCLVDICQMKYAHTDCSHLNHKKGLMNNYIINMVYYRFII